MPDILDRLAAALSDHYRLERELGAGGMATVFLAEDLKHHRKVAVKVLRPDLSASLGSERFLREVAIAANLQHPHVLPLYDSGHTDGFLYYVMPYVDGPSLRQKLLREGELPVPDAVRILRDIADAMAYAHRHGVVHRDIKPENVMLSDRHALVTDFGVAKAVSEATGRQTLTTAGVALGTPAYMAPEQATADPHTDHRADIYALGVVAYEMLTGRTPFTGASPQAVLAAHVTVAAEPVSKHRAAIPPLLAALVMKCLEKKPADRWQSAEEVIPQLEAVLTPSGGLTPTATVPVLAATVAAPGRRRLTLVLVGAFLVVAAAAAALKWWPRGMSAPSGDVREPVVVVPFEVRGTDAALATLSAQAADQITAAIDQATIGKAVSYRVAGLGAGFSPELARSVVKATGAATLVTGVISQRGDSVEVQAKLVRPSDLQTIWSLGPEVRALASGSAALGAIQDRVLGAVGKYLSAAWAERNAAIYQPPPSLEIFRLSDRAEALLRAGNNAGAAALYFEGTARDSTWLHGVERLFGASVGAPQRRQRDSLGEYLERRRARLARGDALTLDLHVAQRDGSPEDEYRAAVALFQADPAVGAYEALGAARRANRPREALEYYLLRDTSTIWGREPARWDGDAALAYHALGRFEDELSLARAALVKDPGNTTQLVNAARALGAMGRADSLEAVFNRSYSSTDRLTPGFAMNTALFELSNHGHAKLAKAIAERAIAWVGSLPEERRMSQNVRNVLRQATRQLGRIAEVRRLYAEEAEAQGAGGLGSRLLEMREAIMLGDTAGALALVDSARTAPLEQSRGSGWSIPGQPLYYGAQIHALLGRKETAVGMLRDALNRGWRVGPDEALQWYWAPLKDYPPFLELVRIKQ